MPTDFTPLLQTVVGGALVVAGQVVAQLYARKNAVHADQRKLALELLLKVEKYCDIVASRSQLVKLEVPDHRTDPLVPLREEIAAHAQALLSKRARKHMEDVDFALWWIRDPTPMFTQPRPVNPYPVKVCCRAVLGAIQRGEAVPRNLLPDFVRLVSSAKAADEDMEHMAAQSGGGET